MPELSDRLLALIAVLGLTAASLGGFAAFVVAGQLSQAVKSDPLAPLRDVSLQSNFNDAFSANFGAADRGINASTVPMISSAGAAPVVESTLPPPKPKHLLAVSIGLLNDAQITGIKNRLGLTPKQAEHWPAVEVALRDVARRHLGRGIHKRGVAPKIDVSSPEVQRLIGVSAPLIRQLREDQKREVRQLVRMIGLETVASRI